MESMKFVREEASSMIDIEFFLNDEELREKYEDDRIAEVIRGKTYEKTKQKINDFIARCEQTLGSLEDRVNQTLSEYDSLASKADREKPGSPPSSFFVNNNDANSVNNYNEKVQKYNNQVEFHQRIVDQALRAKERYEDALGKYDEKKADLEEQIRVKMEDLRPALDQDILTLIGKLQQLAYDNIHNKNNMFSGFLLSYLTKKAYIFLYDYIDNTNEQRAATDIFKKLSEEFDVIITNHSDTVKEGLKFVANHLFSCYKTNLGYLNILQNFLSQLPANECSEAKPEIDNLLALEINTAFEYKHIIDPIELSNVEEEVSKRKATYEQFVKTLETLSSKLSTIFDKIFELNNNSEAELNKMIDNKITLFDPVRRDIFFILSFFDDEDQERYMKKHKQWLQNILEEIQKPFEMELIDLLNYTKQTELLTTSAKTLLSENEVIKFLSNKQSLEGKKNSFLDAINSLKKILDDIGAQPKQKSEEFTKKTGLYLIVSLIPLGNIGILYSIISIISQYMPAFKSTNTFYVDAKNEFIKKNTTFSYIHIALTLICLILSFVLPEQQTLLLALMVTYIISSALLFMKANQIKKMS